MCIPIEHYDNYRVYLREFYEARKKQDRRFSHRYFAQKAGLTSPSHLKEVISGKRNLNSRTIPNFVKGLGLAEHEARYFLLLVKFNQSDDANEKQHYLNQLLTLKRTQTQTVVPLDHFDYYAHWYNVVVRELACTFRWHDDYTLLAASIMPAIKKKQAQESVAFLLDKGFLVRNTDGTYSQSSPSITSGAEVNSLAIRAYNRTMIQLAEKAIDNFSYSERDIQSLTIGISRDGYVKIKKEMQDFIKKIARVAIDDIQSDRVYNLNVQLFPLSKRHSKSDEQDKA